MMTGWNERSFSPDAQIRQSLGQAGELEVETKVINSISGQRDLKNAKHLGVWPSLFWVGRMAGHQQDQTFIN